MRNSLRPFLAALGLALVSLTAVTTIDAAANSSTPNQKLPPALANNKPEGFVVHRSFPAVSGLTGWVVGPEGAKPDIVYTTADGKTLIPGKNLLDQDGKNLGTAYADRYIPKPDLPALVEQLDKSRLLVDRDPSVPVKNTIYVFSDANCPYCSMLHKALEPYKKVGLQVNWVMVGILREDSVTKAAAILENKDPAAALAQVANAGPGVPPLSTAGTGKAETIAQVKAHSALMQKFELSGTPGIVYKDADGKYATKGGLPRLGDLPGILKLPEQPQNDPALLSFIARLNKR